MQAVAALEEPTRRRLYEYVVGRPEPVSRDDAANALGLPRTTAAFHLDKLTEEGLRRRFPDGTPDKVRGQVEHELALIEELKYEPYFLTVHDIVRFARGRGILCQGRGSAANSAEYSPSCLVPPLPSTRATLSAS